MKKNLRDYQQQNAIECAYILKKHNIVYMQHSVRTGKTATALQTVFLNGFKNVLFLTKKKAISSIISDYEDFNFDEYFDLTVCNYESLHNVVGKFDCLVLDENHVNSAFPKPSQRTKAIRLRFSNLPMIMLSGTPATESASQWYHQFWVSQFSPFKQYVNFYKWSKDFVNVKDKHLGYAIVKDYTEGNTEKINQSVQHLVHKFTQEQAGFETKVQENILYCEMLPITHTLIKRLKRDLFIEGKDFTVLADTSVKLQNKLHQMYSGTVKFECGNSMVIDYSKAFFIRDYFKGKKIAIFYYFKEEFNMIKEAFGDTITSDLNEFNTTDKHIALQQYSASEGLNLSKADFLVYLNFGFSGSKFIQSLDRMSTINRLSNNVYFVFGKGGIESKVYKAVSNKKNYTLNQFRKDYDVPRETN
jgi:hypothetical protein